MKYLSFEAWYNDIKEPIFFTAKMRKLMHDAWDAALENKADMLIKNKIQSVIDDTQGKEFKNIKGN